MKRIYFAVVLLVIAAVSWSVELQPPMDTYWISSGSGYRNDPMGGKEESQLHRGLDLVGPHRAPVRGRRGAAFVRGQRCRRDGLPWLLAIPGYERETPLHQEHQTNEQQQTCNHAGANDPATFFARSYTVACSCMTLATRKIQCPGDR